MFVAQAKIYFNLAKKSPKHFLVFNRKLQINRQCPEEGKKGQKTAPNDKYNMYNFHDLPTLIL
jgi:hypothetical protein